MGAWRRGQRCGGAAPPVAGLLEAERRPAPAAAQLLPGAPGRHQQAAVPLQMRVGLRAPRLQGVRGRRVGWPRTAGQFPASLPGSRCQVASLAQQEARLSLLRPAGTRPELWCSRPCRWRCRQSVSGRESAGGAPGSPTRRCERPTAQHAISQSPDVSKRPCSRQINLSAQRASIHERTGRPAPIHDPQAQLGQAMNRLGFGAAQAAATPGSVWTKAK